MSVFTAPIIDIISTHDTLDGGTIRVVHTKGELDVPANVLGNGYRQAVTAWEAIEGNNREPFVPSEPDYAALITAEVERRIFAHASANTQMNMTGAATAGLLTATQMEAYKQGLLWVSSMRSKGAELIASKTADYSSDSHWPKPSAEAVALAEMF